MNNDDNTTCPEDKKRWGAEIFDRITSRELEIGNQDGFLTDCHKQLCELAKANWPQIQSLAGRDAMAAWCLVAIESGQLLPVEISSQLLWAPIFNKSTWIARLAVCLERYRLAHADYSEEFAPNEYLADQVIDFREFKRVRIELFRIITSEIQKNAGLFLSKGELSMTNVPMEFPYFSGIEITCFRKVMELLVMIAGGGPEHDFEDGYSEVQFILSKMRDSTANWMEYSHRAGFIPASYALATSSFDPENPDAAENYYSSLVSSDVEAYRDELLIGSIYHTCSSEELELDFDLLAHLLELAAKDFKNLYRKIDLDDDDLNENWALAELNIGGSFAGKDEILLWEDFFPDLAKQYFVAKRCQKRLAIAHKLNLNRFEFEASLVLEIGKLFELLMYECHLKFDPKGVERVRIEPNELTLEGWRELCRIIPGDDIQEYLKGRAPSGRNNVDQGKWKLIYKIHKRGEWKNGQWKGLSRSDYGKLLLWVCALVIDANQMENHPFRSLFTKSTSFGWLDNLWKERNKYAHGSLHPKHISEAWRLPQWAESKFKWIDAAAGLFAEKLKTSN